MKRHLSSSRRCSGQSSVEYLLILVLVALLLIHGDLSPLEQFFDAIKLAYRRFTYAMSAL